MSTLDHFVDINKMIILAKGAQRFPSHSEQLPPAEDVRKVERRLTKEDKKSLGDNKKIQK